ncbi:MAG: hypothetical protein Q9214_006932, partial [Letrouitia sp. 1 TL-2023]
MTKIGDAQCDESQQHDEDPAIQEFLRDFQHDKPKPSSLWRRGCTGSGNDIETKYISPKTLQAKLHVQRVGVLLDVLFTGSDQQKRPTAKFVYDDYLRPFTVLLCIGCGPMIYYFIKHNSLEDRKLPFYDRPDDFPTSTRIDIWEEFY